MEQFFRVSCYPDLVNDQYYNAFFKKYNIDASYTSVYYNNLEDTLKYISTTGASGFCVSIPFKNEIINYLDSMESLVLEYDSCNTVLLIDGKMHGYNTDFYGAREVLDAIPNSYRVLILGDGVMGRMIFSMLPYATVCSLNLGNWDKRYNTVFDVIINCTTIGSSSEESPFSQLPISAQLVIDLAKRPNLLQSQCLEMNVKYLSGVEFFKYKFIHKFKLYTGKDISIYDFNEIRF